RTKLIRVLTFDEATKQNDATKERIEDELADLQVRATSQTTALVFFSGHGLTHGNQVFLCPTNASLENLQTSAISGSDFSKMLSHVHAGKLLVILDACHAGGAASLKGPRRGLKAGLPESYYADLYSALDKANSRVIIASSGEYQESLIYLEQDLSLFTFYFLEALEGGANGHDDGVVRVLDVFSHVSLHVPLKSQEIVSQDESLRQQLGDKFRQVPVLKAEARDDFPIGFYRSSKSWSW